MMEYNIAKQSPQSDLVTKMVLCVYAYVHDLSHQVCLDILGVQDPLEGSRGPKLV